MSLTIFFIVVIAMLIGTTIFYATRVQKLNQQLKDAKWEAVAANTSWENEQYRHKQTANQLESCQKKCRDKDAQIEKLEKELAPLRVTAPKSGSPVLPSRKTSAVPSKQEVKEGNEKRAANARKKSGNPSSGYGSTSKMASAPMVDNTPMYVATAVAVAASSPSYDPSPSSYDCGSSSPSVDCSF